MRETTRMERRTSRTGTPGEAGGTNVFSAWSQTLGVYSPHTQWHALWAGPRCLARTVPRGILFLLSPQTLDMRS